MMKCTKCISADAVMRAGFIRGRQRFFCKACDYHFTDNKELPAPERKRHQTTISDVAKVLGVAPSTVSRALNGHSDINSNTRQAIIEVARQLDYQPNLLAQSLKSSETYTIGVVIPDIERPFFATAVSGIQEVAAEAGYRVMICQSKESYEMEVSNVQALVASRVDGLLICHSRDTENFEHVKQHASRGVPIVHFDRVCNEVDSAQVVLDDWGGAYAVTEHLIQEGCQRIAILAGPESLLISKQRISGYQNALKRYRRPVRPEYEVHSDFQPESALAALDAWMALPEPPDAIFAISYRNAFDIMLALKKRGLRIPQDVAVAGFGDEFLAALVEPGLTTVNLHPHRLGQQAARLFLEQVRQKESFKPRTYVVSGDLVIRQSSLKGAGGYFKLEI
ncbi:LacI family DNA-binding transcriptional regulator [Hymenobacter sediminicola]|uniref:LacI family DNA-binding transcriptional regulator n=1 Tax=Hymenobacter sediminicola TaxID=2761579 RepID=A0A7G7W5K6_9BACT|nr:substrate-binding domain-containing protein [Hymenobacter sediminicola]QNH61649.1 LacI family DNA-binding transcriptional regulator [Hymenobacter sediminicola]